MFLALLLAAQLAEAPPPPDARIAPPDWIAAASADEMARVFPIKAMFEGMSGKATLACMTTLDTTVTGCRVVEETPPGYGFGEAALKVAGSFRIRPMTVNGKPTPGEIRIPVAFSPPAGSLPPGDAASGGPVVKTARVALSCLADSGGRLVDCKVASESPPAQGFGKAALEMIAQVPPPASGLPQGSDGRIMVYTQFNLAPGQEGAKPK